VSEQTGCTYHLRDHVPVELDVALSFPDDVHVELDAAIVGLVGVHLGDLDGNSTEVELDELEGGERAREHGGEHGLDDVLDHLAADDVDVGPELGDDVIEESYSARLLARRFVDHGYDLLSVLTCRFGTARGGQLVHKSSHDE
jgi:hypothetical protein